MIAVKRISSNDGSYLDFQRKYNCDSKSNNNYNNNIMGNKLLLNFGACQGNVPRWRRSFKML